MLPWTVPGIASRVSNVPQTALDPRVAVKWRSLRPSSPRHASASSNSPRRRAPLPSRSPRQPPSSRAGAHRRRSGRPRRRSPRHEEVTRPTGRLRGATAWPCGRPHAPPPPRATRGAFGCCRGRSGGAFTKASRAASPAAAGSRPIARSARTRRDTRARRPQASGRSRLSP
jgi:hypothetical protein